MIIITIIGVGNLGAWHLQAVVQMTQPIKIYVVDVLSSSLNAAQAAYDQVPHDSVVEIQFLNSVKQISEDIDVAVIATSSLSRRQVIGELVNHIHVKYLVLEKFLFPALNDYDATASLLTDASCKAWVNCARRMQPLYQELKKHFQSESNIVCSVTGGNWGLGCNGIHMVDMLAFLLEDTSFSFNTTYLDPGYVGNKRHGYIEFTGTLTGRSNKCAFISLYSDRNNSYPMVISIQNQNIRCIIEESLGRAFIAKRENDWAVVPMEFSILYQSQLTGLLVGEIMNTANCQLPVYEESSCLHKSLLSAYLSHYNACRSEAASICPIT
jgi:predicted dehydrogenase